MMNWRRSSTTFSTVLLLRHRPSLLGIFLNTYSTHRSHVWWRLRLRTALLQNEVHKVSPSLPALGPPSQWHSSVVELILWAGHWNTSSWQAAPAVSLICQIFNKKYCNIYIGLHPQFGGFGCHSGPRAAPEVSSGPRSEKVARLWPITYTQLDNSDQSSHYAQTLGVFRRINALPTSNQ